MHIRAATLSDLTQLAHLFDGYRIFYKQPSDIEHAEKFLEERISKNQSQILVAEMEAGILGGFVQLYPIYSSVRMCKLWLLNDLFVAPEYRGKNVGVRLMENAKQLAVATQACGLILETAKSNEIGNALYPKVGFQLDQDHNYYFWDCPAK